MKIANTYCKLKICADDKPEIFIFCKLRSMATAPLPFAISNPGKSKGSMGGILNFANPRMQEDMINEDLMFTFGF